MHKIISLLLLFSVLRTGAQESGKFADPKFVFAYKETSFETEDYKIYIEDAVNVDAFAKFKVRVFNKTNDYLVLKPADINFKIGNQSIFGKDKQLVIPPNEEASKVIDAKGKGLQEEKYTLEIKNVYKISYAVTPVKTEDLAIPTTKKEFTTGPFQCKIKRIDLQTNKTLLRIECTYTGDMIGVLAPNKAIAIMPKGQENQNVYRNKNNLMEKGRPEDFVVDIREMKNAGDLQKDPWKIVWGETFRESKMEPIPGGTIPMEIDRKKTAEKNQ
jgi:hypothetical protein